MNKLARARPLPRRPVQRRGGGLRLSGWTVAILALTALVAAPVVVVLGSLAVPTGEVWQHLSSTVLPRYVANSLWLVLGVGVGTLLVGVGTAWLTTMCRFPGRRVLEWALLLPMAIPAYILAYTYTDFLQFSGPLQSFLRDLTGWGARDYWFPNIRSLGGAVVLLTLALYPYVYLLARTAFLEQSTTMLEATQCLRCSPWASFFRLSLPLARPAIVAGVSLALMETLSDFGTVDYFGIQTFTTGIYRTWFGLGEHLAAVQLAAWLLVFVLALVAVERGSRRGWRHSSSSTRHGALLGYPLRGGRAALAFVACFLPVFVGFLLPAWLLANLTLNHAQRAFNPQFWSYARNSLTLAVAAAVLAVVVGLVLAYGVRIRPTFLNRLATRVAAIGYAVPGSVIAVSILMSFGWADNGVDGFMRATFGVSTGLLLSGTFVGLIFAYLVRFLTASFNTLETGLNRVTKTMDDAALTLGQRSVARLFKVHVPLLRGSLLTAALLVFVDVIKELPATLIVRPFNLDTLAVRVYRLASDERLVEASGGALAIVLVGLLPVLVLSVAIARTRPRKPVRAEGSSPTKRSHRA